MQKSPLTWSQTGVSCICRFKRQQYNLHSGSGPVDYDHSVDSDTIQISAYITPTIASSGTDVSIAILGLY